MKAIILAAGLGSRLKPLTDTMPKCLTEINGKSILDKALEHLASVGVEETIVVVGHLKDKIKDRCGNSFSRMLVTYVENGRYAATNTSYSLWLGLQNVSGEDVVLLEGDVFFARNLLEGFLSRGSPNSTVVQKYNPTLDGSFVALKNNTVIDWIHATRRASDFVIADKFKTVNIHKFDATFVDQTLKPVLQQHIQRTQGVEPLEYVMEDIVKNTPASITAWQANGLKWFEIDDVHDLQIAEKIFAKPSLDTVRSFHGGYWRYDHLDFHYLFNHYFPTPELYAELSQKIPTIGNYYPSSQQTLARLLSQWKKEKEYFAADNLIVGNGSSELIRLLNDHVVTKVTVPLPTYNEFVQLPEEKLHTYVLDETHNFVLDSDRLIAEVIQSKSEFAVIVNPNNPVGNLALLEDIEKILATGVTLIVDEAFMVFAGAHYSAEQLVPNYKNLVIVVSCTKSIGIAGLRLGYMLTANTEIQEKIRSHLPIWNVNSLTEYLLEVLPSYREEHAASIAKSVADTKWFFESLREIPYLTPYPTHANAVFCKVRGSSRRLAEILYDHYNLMIKEGLNQKELATDSYVRLGVRNRPDNEKLLAALREISQTDLLVADELRVAVGG